MYVYTYIYIYIYIYIHTYIHICQIPGRNMHRYSLHVGRKRLFPMQNETNPNAGPK